MKAVRPTKSNARLAAIPGIDEEYARHYPYANVALAVTQLRGRLGLTQSQFAERLGSTQSVIARLESGRHGIQISLLNRIADAFDTNWKITFDADDIEPEVLAQADFRVSTSGDVLLEAFNEASTSGDVAAAHRLAAKMRRDPSTGRRVLALAIDAYNHGQFKGAWERATEAIAKGLPSESEDAARLVAGRSLLGLNRPAEVLEVLEGSRKGLAAATLGEALLELGRIPEAIELAEHLRETEPPEGQPAASFLAARVYWHANRPYAALSAAAAFHALKPGKGALIQGAILGYIGDQTDDEDAYRQAMVVLQDASPDDYPDVLRLRAMTAARLRNWTDAFECLEMLTEADGANAQRSVAAVVVEVFDRLDDPEEVDAAVDRASSRGLIDEALKRRYKAHACALRGDFEGSVAALGLTVARLGEASEEDQLRCASALLIGNQVGRALAILKRNQKALSLPDGYLFLAKAALAERDLQTARMALGQVAQHRGEVAETARVAVDLLSAIDRVATEDVLARFSLTWQVYRPRVVEVAVPETAPASPWEGPATRKGPQHEPASPVLDRLTREHVSQMPIH
jgi:transcriptional regulator with XRE-family HTH domain